MAFSGKILADGQVPDSQGVIYLVPSGTTAYIRFLTVYNTGGDTEEVVLWVRPSGGTARRVARAVLIADAFSRIIDIEALPLGEGDAILAATTTAATVDYLISGAEET